MIDTLIFFCAALIVTNAAQTQNDPESIATRLIVRVHGAGTGGGIVIGTSGPTAIILTARHVVVGKDPVTVEFRGYDPTPAVVERSSEAADLAVLRATVAPSALRSLQFNLLGDSDSMARGSQVYPIGHNSPAGWYRPVQPLFLRGMQNGLLSFEALVNRTKGSSGGGLFDDQWRLIGMMISDDPPEVRAVPIRVALEHVSEWGYQVSLSKAARSQNPVAGAGNVKYAIPAGWTANQRDDQSIVLSEPFGDARIIVIPGKPLIKKFEETFDEMVEASTTPLTLAGPPRPIQLAEGYQARFIEGTTIINRGGLTNPERQEFAFFYLACNPVGRYEAILYLNSRYMFEKQKPILNKFIESLRYRNVQALTQPH